MELAIWTLVVIVALYAWTKPEFRALMHSIAARGFQLGVFTFYLGTFISILAGGVGVLVLFSWAMRHYASHAYQLQHPDGFPFRDVATWAGGVMMLAFFVVLPVSNVVLKYRAKRATKAYCEQQGLPTGHL